MEVNHKVMLKKTSKEAYIRQRASGLPSLYLISIFGFFPLIYNDYYFDILPAKYKFYYCVTLIFIICTALVKLLEVAQPQKGVAVSKKLSGTEYWIIAFWMIAVISTVLSDYKFEAFWGNEGRYTGLFLITLYVASFLIVSRNLKFENWMLAVFCIASILVCAFGITDYFRMDILNFKKQIDPNQADVFVSTMGNINAYTAFVAYFMAITTTLYATSEKGGIKRIITYVSMLISFFALIMGNSDNAYLSLGALFAILPFFVYKKRGGIKRFVITLASFFSTIKMIELINAAMGNRVIGINGLFEIVSSSSFLLGIILILWAVYIILEIPNHPPFKAMDKYQNCSKRIFIVVWCIFLTLTTCILAYLLYDSNVNDNYSAWGAIGNYLHFSEEWGSYRGKIWKLAFRYFERFSVLQKIIGFGPETFGILMVNNDYADIQMTGVVYDNAHNEYIHMLITMGISGVLSYLLFLGTSIKRILKNLDKNKYLAPIAMAIICYSAQAFVNISSPVTSPYLWLLLAVGNSICMNHQEVINR